MAFPAQADIKPLRRQFDDANDVQTPEAAVAIASTFGLSNACASQANQVEFPMLHSMATLHATSLALRHHFGEQFASFRYVFHFFLREPICRMTQRMM